MREEFDYTEVRGIGGINQQEHLADPKLELADAKNVWAPDGAIEKRPGYWGVGTVSTAAAVSIETAFSTGFQIENPIGTFGGSIDGLPVGKRWYAGFDALDTQTDYPMGLRMRTPTSNIKNVRIFLEYWNGTEWVMLRTVEADNDTGVVIHKHLSVTNDYIYFPWPQDITFLNVAGANLYWIRGTLYATPDTELTTPIIISEVDSLILDMSGKSPANLFTVVLQFTNATRFIYTNVDSTAPLTTWINSADLAGPSNANEIKTSATKYYGTAVEEPPSVAIVAEFNEAYIAWAHKTTVHKASISSISDTMSPAVVETNPGLVGPDADYDPSYVSQLGSWPEAQYIAYHRGEMWAANFLTAPTEIRWSAGSKAYRVWPLLNVDVLQDVDPGPITGLYAFNQNMFVFKDRSIWQMIFTGPSNQGGNTYRAEKIVVGTGCISNSGIQEVQGQLIFPGVDGIYAFNGGKAEKISQKIQKTFDKIVPGRRRFAVSCNWREKSLYMLAVNTTNGASNDTIIVWDYKNNTWWVWDNFDIVSLFVLGQRANKEQIYFRDAGGRVFEMGKGHNDNGGDIIASITTQRLQDNLPTKRLRIVQPECSNFSRAVTVEAQPNDAPFDGAVTSELLYSDVNEKEYLTAIYDADKYTVERQRFAHVGTLVSGDWFRVKVTHNQKYAPWTMKALRIGSVPVGVRP